MPTTRRHCGNGSGWLWAGRMDHKGKTDLSLFPSDFQLVRLGKSSEPWSLRADTDLRGPVIWRVMRPGSPGSSWVPVHEAIPAPTLPARNGARAPALRTATELPGLLAPMPRPVGARSGQDPGHRKSTGLGGTDAALRPGPAGSIRAGGGGQWRELWKSVGRCAGVNKVSAMGGGRTRGRRGERHTRPERGSRKLGADGLEKRLFLIQGS